MVGMGMTQIEVATAGVVRTGQERPSLSRAIGLSEKLYQKTHMYLVLHFPKKRYWVT